MKVILNAIRLVAGEHAGDTTGASAHPSVLSRVLRSSWLNALPLGEAGSGSVPLPLDPTTPGRFRPHDEDRTPPSLDTEGAWVGKRSVTTNSVFTLILHGCKKTMKQDVAGVRLII